MGDSEDGRSRKAEKSPPPVEQTNMHVYPDWATMQAYYGPRVPVPPYFNPAVASGHPPHPYMWAPPQSIMTPYGPQYAVYPHGCVYSHPGLPPANASLGMETPTKTSANSDQGLAKKVKEFDGLEMSIGNGNASSEGRANRGISQSSEETEGSSGGSNGSSAEADQKGKKRSRDGSLSNDEDGKDNPQIGPPVGKEGSGAAARMLMVASVDGGNKNITEMSMALELKTSTTPNANTNNIIKSQMIPAEPWLQNEREQKREKRKQSNRESARRSRLRKQAEAEELAIKVQSLTAENMAIKSEINKLAENSKKLKLENTAIMDKLHNAREQTETMMLGELDDRRQHPVHTADLLAKVDNNSGYLDENIDEKASCENKRSEAKLYPLLGSSSMSDALAAG